MKEYEKMDDLGAFPVKLSYLGSDLLFMLRSLRGYLRSSTAQAFAGLEAEPGEIAILNLVGINPGVSQNDLAAALVIKKSAATKVIKSLEARGLLSRRKSETDRRYNAITLTREGEDKLALIRARMKTMHEQLFDGFSEGEQIHFFEQMRRLLMQAHTLHNDATGGGSGQPPDDDRD